jgi:hypothetical protein
MAKSRIRRDPSLKGKGMATAGLIIGYGVIIFAVSAWAVIILFFGAALKDAVKQAQQQIATNHPPIVETQSAVASNDTQLAVAPPDNPPAAQNNFGWTLDVKSAEFPDSPVSGKLHGADFTGKKVSFRNGTLKIAAASGGESLTIHGLRPILENSSYEFQLAAGDEAPKIDIGWSEDGQAKSETITTGYAMKLKFDKAAKRKVHAQIYLCLPDDSKSYAAGTFEVPVPKKKP